MIVLITVVHVRNLNISEPVKKNFRANSILIYKFSMFSSDVYDLVSVQRDTTVPYLVCSHTCGSSRCSPVYVYQDP